MSNESNILWQANYCMEDNRLNEGDVLWVGSECGKYAMSWQEFKELARDLICDPYADGGHDCATDLVIVFDDCWLARFDECGQHGWEYMRKPVRAASTIKPCVLSGEYSPMLDVINCGKEQNDKDIAEFKRKYINTMVGTFVSGGEVKGE